MPVPITQALQCWFEALVSCGSKVGPGVLVIIDPISTGARLAEQATERGFEVVACWSESIPDALRNFVDKALKVRYVAVVNHFADCLDETVREIRAVCGDRLAGVLVGCETGVTLGDDLSEALGVRTNGTAKSALRRNKWLQTEAVRETGANACKQFKANSMDDVESVLKTWPAGPFKAVVKPVVGAGSDGVTICNSKDEVRKAFLALEGSKNVLGLTTYEVLVQEYLVGEEYVVDTVSRDGVHKCVALWKYDKRLYNGSPVVYFGMRLLQIDDEPELREMVRYTLGVLEVLGVRNGAIHTEIKLEARGPVLIEANCRLHGGEGTWAPMAEACMGYSAVSALLDAYFDPCAFARLPVVPCNFACVAMEAKLRSPVEGVLKSINHERLAVLRGLPSFTAQMLAVEVGKPIKKTIDAVSACGNFNLVHKDKAILDADYATFHEVVAYGLFEVAPQKSAAIPAPAPGLEASPTLSSFLAQSPKASPDVLAFHRMQPSPPSSRIRVPIATSPSPPSAAAVPNGGSAPMPRFRASS